MAGGHPMPARFLTAVALALLVASAGGCDDDCGSPTDPCEATAALTGAWSGSSTYVNAPFTMQLQQSGANVTGQYRDQKDTGSVNGTVDGQTVVLDVNFGDTGFRMTGVIISPNRVTGEIMVPALGGRRFPFEMLR